MSTESSLSDVLVEDFCSFPSELIRHLQHLEDTVASQSFFPGADVPVSDRLIPLRTSADAAEDFEQEPREELDKTSTPQKGVPDCILQEALLGSGSDRLLRYSCQPIFPAPASYDSSLQRLLNLRESSIAKAFKKSHLSFRIHRQDIVSRPGLVNDFYSNLISWSSEYQFYTAFLNETHSQILSFGFDRDFKMIKNSQFKPLDNSIPSSLKAYPNQYLLSGWKNNSILLHDVSQVDADPIQRFQMSPPSRPRNIGVAAMDTIDQNLFASVSLNGVMGLFDKRQAQEMTQTNLLEDYSLGFEYYRPARLLNIQYNGQQSLVLSSDSAAIFHFDIRNLAMPVSIIEDDYHRATGLKAMAFHKHQAHVLVTGGGLNSRDLVVRDIRNNRLLAQFSTGNQISGISWLNANLFVVSYGFSHAGLAIFKFDKNHQIELLTAYYSSISERFIYMDTFRNRVAIGTANEQIKVFDIQKLPIKKRKPFEDFGNLHQFALTIR